MCRVALRRGHKDFSVVIFGPKLKIELGCFWPNQTDGISVLDSMDRFKSRARSALLKNEILFL